MRRDLWATQQSQPETFTSLGSPSWPFVSSKPRLRAHPSRPPRTARARKATRRPRPHAGGRTLRSPNGASLVHLVPRLLGGRLCLGLEGRRHELVHPFRL